MNLQALVHPIRWWRRRHHAKAGWVSEAERVKWAWFWEDREHTGWEHLPDDDSPPPTERATGRSCPDVIDESPDTA